MVLNRPQNAIESTTFRHFRIDRPQDPFNDAGGLTPGVDDEIFAEGGGGDSGTVVFAEGGGGDSGDVLIEEA